MYHSQECQDSILLAWGEKEESPVSVKSFSLDGHAPTAIAPSRSNPNLIKSHNRNRGAAPITK